MDFILHIIHDVSLYKEDKGNEGVTSIQATRSLLMNYTKKVVRISSLSRHYGLRILK